MEQQEVPQDSPKTKIAVFRLVTGEDVITEFEDMKDKYFKWIHPMKLVNKKLDDGGVGVFLLPWMPSELMSPITGYQCFVGTRDIMTLFPIRESMKFFYTEVRGAVERKLLKNNEKTDRNLLAITATYLDAASKDPAQVLLEEWNDYFDNLDDNEGIIYN